MCDYMFAFSSGWSQVQWAWLSPVLLHSHAMFQWGVRQNAETEDMARTFTFEYMPAINIWSDITKCMWKLFSGIFSFSFRFVKETVKNKTNNNFTNCSTSSDNG